MADAVGAPSSCTSVFDICTDSTALRLTAYAGGAAEQKKELIPVSCVCELLKSRGHQVQDLN